MKKRPSARLLVLDPDNRVLLFRFAHSKCPQAGTSFWATPGGAVDPGESYEQAAARELAEETGVTGYSVGPQVAQRTVVFAMPDGELVEADERYFVVWVKAVDISSDGWTEGKVSLSRHNESWGLAFDQEATHSQVLFDAGVRAIEHIGSTAILNIRAKPILDIMVGLYQSTPVRYKDWFIMHGMPAVRS